MKHKFSNFMVIALLLIVAEFSTMTLSYAADASQPTSETTTLPETGNLTKVLQQQPLAVEKEFSISQHLLKNSFKAAHHKQWLSLHQNLRDRQWEMYRRWKMASRGGYVNSPSIELEATAYDPGPRSCGRNATGRTATGMHAGYSIAAVDPRVIPLGTHLYVEGYGYAIAADTGSAIKGYRIDLCFNSYGEALQYGRKRVRVYILDR